MSPVNLNLARDPFLNRGPVKRFQIVLWLLGAILLALNVNSYLQNRRDSTELRERLQGIDRQIEHESEAIVELQDTLRALGPQEQNSRVDFLNQRIAERTFPWGELFDDLGKVLPKPVRLRSVNPKVDRRSRGARASRVKDGDNRRVSLAITGVAKREEALYLLVDRFFAHPRFSDPDLNSERTLENGQLSFVLGVTYLPRARKAGSENPGDGASGDDAPGDGADVASGVAEVGAS